MKPNEGAQDSYQLMYQQLPPNTKINCVFSFNTKQTDPNRTKHKIFVSWKENEKAGFVVFSQ